MHPISGIPAPPKPARAHPEAESDGRFEPPPPPHPFLWRPRLAELLDEASTSQVTVVTGPAGSGKTVLVSGWARQRHQLDLSWLTLDPSHNDPRHLVASVLSAAGCAHPDPGDVDALCAGSPVCHRPGGTPGRRTLVLDDLRVVVERQALAAVEPLVSALADDVRLVVLSREDPTFVRNRHRLGGHVADVRQRDLRFNAEEALALLSAVARRHVTDADAAALTERTEGWAAGLQMAGILLRDERDPSRFVQRFAGETRFVAEYLVEEVLETLPDELVRFLLLTSVLDRLTGPLCTAVTGAADAPDILEQLVARNLFVVPLDTEHRSYRYHRLFAELLRHMLRVRAPAEEAPARRRAATWFEHRGQRRPAVAQLVAAGRRGDAGALDRAFDLAASVIPPRLFGGVAAEDTFRDLDPFPVDYVAGDADRALAMAAGLVAGRRAAEAQRWLSDARAAPADVARDALIRLLDVVGADTAGDADTVARRTRDVAGATADGSRCGDRNGLPAWMNEALVAAPRIMACAAVRAALWLGDLGAARRAVATLGELSDPECPDAVTAVAVSATLAFVAAASGSLCDARRHAVCAFEAAEAATLATAPAVIGAHVAMAIVGRRRDELALADEHVAEAGRLATLAGQRGWSAYVALQRVANHLADGRIERATAELHALSDADVDGGLPRWAHSLVDIASVEIRVAAGDVEGARRSFERVTACGRHAVLAARLDLASGRARQALRCLNDGARRSPTAPDELERLVLLSCAEAVLHRLPSARRSLRRAVDLARPERERRVFLDAPPQIAPLLGSLATPFPDPFLDDLAACAARSAEPVPEPDVPMVEELTERERVVLDYLPSHLSQQEMADRLYISLNTLKTHLKALYRKLGVSSRSEAVAAAEGQGLL